MLSCVFLKEKTIEEKNHIEEKYEKRRKIFHFSRATIQIVTRRPHKNKKNGEINKYSKICENKIQILIFFSDLFRVSRSCAFHFEGVAFKNGSTNSWNLDSGQVLGLLREQFLLLIN